MRPSPGIICLMIRKFSLAGWCPAHRKPIHGKGKCQFPGSWFAKTNQGIRLVQQPSSIIKNNLAEFSKKSMIEMKDLKLSNGEISINKQDIIQGNSYWLDAELVVEPGTTAGFKIAQKKDKDNKTISETEIGYDALKNQLYVDRSNAGNGKIKKDKLRQTIDLTNKGKVRLEILFDKSSLEIFVNNGEKVLSTYTFPDEGANLLSAFAVGGSALIKSLTVWDLSKINKD